MKKALLYIAIFVLGFSVCYFNINKPSLIEGLPIILAPPNIDTVIVEVPTYVKVPDRILQLKFDSIAYNNHLLVDSLDALKNKLHYYIEVVDSLKMYIDYISIRTYPITFFDNEYGKYSADLKVLYNELQSINNSIFTPKLSSIKMRPYLSTAISTSLFIYIGGGFMRGNYGIGYEYLYDLKDNRNGHLIRGFKIF